MTPGFNEDAVNNVQFGLRLDDFWINTVESSHENVESPALAMRLRSHQVTFDAIVDTGACKMLLKKPWWIKGTYRYLKRLTCRK